jgi:hypothetical protein
VNELLVAVLRPVAVALMVYPPIVPTIWHPAKVATPEMVVAGLVVHDDTVPLPEATVRETDAEGLRTVLP